MANFIWHALVGFFSKHDNKKNIKSQCDAKSVTEINEEIDDFAQPQTPKNGIHSKSLKRHQTCSIDLSDKSYRPRNTQELSDIESTTPLPRTSSFNLYRDFPKKLLPICDFEEIEILGQGAFGRAIKVQYMKNGAYFVMKEVLSHSPENEESLIREVSLLRSLKHTNVLTCLGLVLKNKSICLLTELMHGGSLQSKINDLDQTISLNQKLLFLRDIAAGMNFLHQNSIMHRDLTSSNCLLRRNNTVVVSDFGLSKFLNTESENHKFHSLISCRVIRSSSSEVINNNIKTNEDTKLKVTELNRKLRNVLSVGDVSQFVDEDKLIDEYCSRFENLDKRKSMNLRRKHTVVGNPFWMAPEMLAGKNYNCLVDIYSYGIIGCEVTARISAHPDYLDRHNKDMSVNFEEFIKKNKGKELINCPEELISIIRKCCKTDPDKRPTFNNILSLLEDILFRLSNNLQLKISWSKSS